MTSESGHCCFKYFGKARLRENLRIVKPDTELSRTPTKEHTFHCGVKPTSWTPASSSPQSPLKLSDLKTKSMWTTWRTHLERIICLISSSSSGVKMIFVGVGSIKKESSGTQEGAHPRPALPPELHWKGTVRSWGRGTVEHLDAFPEDVWLAPRKQRMDVWGGTWTGWWNNQVSQICGCRWPMPPFQIREAQGYTVSCSPLSVSWLWGTAGPMGHNRAPAVPPETKMTEGKSSHQSFLSYVSLPSLMFKTDK